MPDRFDHSLLLESFEFARQAVESLAPDADMSPTLLRDLVNISRQADAIRERSPRNVVANHIGQWMRANDLPTKWRDDGQPLGLSRPEAILLMREHWQDPVGFHESVAARLGIEEEEYGPDVTLTVPRELLRELEDAANTGPRNVDAMKRLSEKVRELLDEADHER